MYKVLFLIFLSSLLVAGCAAMFQDILDDAVDRLAYSVDDASACEKKCLAKEGDEYKTCYEDCLRDRNLTLKESRNAEATARSQLRREDVHTCDCRCNQKDESARSACVRDCRWELSSTFLERLNRKTREKRPE